MEGVEMENETVRKLLTDVALTHPKPDDSAELRALRNVSLALLHIAEGIAEIQRTQAE
jgi:hypothetical protein